MLTVYVVSHTHWDREWYHRAERFRQRLADLVDELLDAPAADGSSFLLDGQTIVLEDYLAVRPERASELAAALRDGRIEAGPWYVLADELIPSAEGLVRNLLAGRRSLRALRAESPPVLYCPDSFGHPAALPTLARGFGCDVIVVWRGFGGSRWPGANTFWWVAPDADRVLTYHLSRSGYELGANLPADPEDSRARWQRVLEQITERRTTDVGLLLNGADHHARQHRREQAVRTLARVAEPALVRSGTLRDFATALSQDAARAALPDVRGELRDSYGFTWTLQGTLASRTPLKRRYVRRERELLRDTEPWVALAAFEGRQSRRHLVNAAWRELLACQPHDTLCGCSIDEVARAMDDRLAGVGAQSAGLRRDAIQAWLGHGDTGRTDRNAWTPTVVVRNRVPRVRSGVAVVEVVSTLADVPVGPGSPHVRIDRVVLPRTPRLEGIGSVQVLSRRLDHDRIESARDYPDNDAVQRLQAAVWLEDVPAYGLTCFPFARRTSRPSRKANVEHVQAGNGELTNGRITFRYADDGAVALEQAGRVLRNFVEWESRRDRGDLYTPAVREPKLVPRLLNTRLLHRGPWRASVEQRWRLRDRENRVDARLRFVLDAGADWLRVHVAGVNGARDHRLRLRFRTDVAAGAAVADAAYGLVERRRLIVDPAAAAVEEPLPTAPLQRYVSMFDAQRGATLFSDGLTEYETDGGTFAVTVLRSVGELSRSDIAERPGHAGWPEPTPDAQCLGPFDAELAIMLHDARSEAVTHAIEHAADDVLFPLTGHTLRNARETFAPRHGVSLEGTGLSFAAAKESEDGGWLVLRCVNLLDRETGGVWRLARPVVEARLARLDETPLTPLEPRGESIPFLAPAGAVVTVLVR